MIRIAVCDDEQCFVEQIHTILSGQAKEISSALHISTYTDSGQLLYDVEEGAHFDLLFLDIEMPGTDGMSLAGAIRRFLPLALIVFITSHTKYAVKAFELSVFRYTPKPELAACLPLALKDACRLLERNSNDTYVIESPRRVRKIAVDDILYIYKDQKYAVFVLENEELPVRRPLEQVLAELCGEERDGGFLMGHSDLVTSLQERKKINVLLFNNNGHQCIHNLQRSQGSDTFGTEFRYREDQTGELSGGYLPIDFCKVAEGYGAKSYRVHNASELKAAIEDARKQTVSTLIEIVVLPGTMTGGYANFWRVGTAEVSEKPAIQEAYKKLHEVVKTLRKY